VENRAFNVNFARLVTLERSAHNQSKQQTHRVRIRRGRFLSVIVDKLMTSV
jgi:hypothetical protein